MNDSLSFAQQFLLAAAAFALMLLFGAVTYSQDVKPVPSEVDRWFAESDGKPVAVLIGAEWCPACKEMRRDLNAAKMSYRYLDFDRDAKRMEGLLMPVEKGRGFLPQFIVLTKGATGWERHAIIGKTDAETARAFAKGYGQP